MKKLELQACDHCGKRELCARARDTETNGVFRVCSECASLARFFVLRFAVVYQLDRWLVYDTDNDRYIYDARNDEEKARDFCDMLNNYHGGKA